MKALMMSMATDVLRLNGGTKMTGYKPIPNKAAMIMDICDKLKIPYQQQLYKCNELAIKTLWVALGCEK
jgi:hypothetical protein